MMKVVLLSLLFTLFIGVNQQTNAQFWKKKESKKVRTDKPKKAKKKSAYEKLIKNAKVSEGMFKLIEKEGKIYFEIPKKVMKYDFLLTSRVTKVSVDINCTSGRIPKEPVLIKFTADTSKLFIHIPTRYAKCDKNSIMYDAYKNNHLDPIWKAFKIKAFNKDSSALVVDITKLFLGSDKKIDPFSPPRNVIEALSPFKGSLEKEKSKILSTKTFSDNIRVKTQMGYTVKGQPYTVEMSRNIIKLPEVPMNIRYSDDRFGYFEHKYYNFKPEGVDVKSILNRWRIEPKKEDINKYNNGELVEPAKPIVWYVDTAIPSKWREHIKAGIEDWQIAFEKIGFKNAIIAKDYPTKEEDPNFDPDDIKYSCYRYIPTHIKNSMGPSWTDPRTGEILTGDVLFYSNVVKLLQQWRFVQTAQLDSRVRTEKMNDKLIGESLRNVAAHEIGHTLGLMHNFVASTTYPVDSLRSVKFTKKYGTTPSIMDYARYNYVAQPTDKGVYMLPPKVGIYDIFQIQLGYKYVSKATTPEEDHKEVAKWLFAKKDDPRYTYVNPYGHKYINAANNTEAIGDDPIKAGMYGIKNLRYIESNLVDWLVKDGNNFDYLRESHYAIGSQFLRYMHHVIALLGGEYRTPTYAGYNIKRHKYVSKKKQKEAVKFLVSELRKFPTWWNNKKVDFCIGESTIANDVQVKLFLNLFSGLIAESLSGQEVSGIKNSYTYSEYQNDIFKLVWRNKKSLTATDKTFQSTYVDVLVNVINPGTPIDISSLFGYKEFNFTEEHEVLMRNISKDIVTSIKYPVIGAMAEETLALLKKLKDSAPRKDRIHYKALYFKLNKAMKN